MAPTFKRSAALVVPATLISVVAISFAVFIRAVSAWARAGVLSGANRSEPNWLLSNYDLALLFWLPLALALTVTAATGLRQWLRLCGVMLVKGAVMLLPLLVMFAGAARAADQSHGLRLVVVALLFTPVAYTLFRWALAVPAVAAGAGVIGSLRASTAATRAWRGVLAQFGPVLATMLAVLAFTPLLLLVVGALAWNGTPPFVLALLLAGGLGTGLARVVAWYQKRQFAVYAAAVSDAPSNRSDGSNPRQM